MISHMFRASRLRQRITIRKETDVSDGKGGYTRTWSDVAHNIPAEVVSENGREVFLGRVLQGINNYRITIRYMSGIDATQQILYGAEELNITSVSDPDGRRKLLDIRANTATPQSSAVDPAPALLRNDGGYVLWSDGSKVLLES